MKSQPFCSSLVGLADKDLTHERENVPGCHPI
jgi:hypothetical protein